MAKVAFVGLGVMGFPMAGHLKGKGGHEVTVYNRTAAKAEEWVGQYGGKSAPTPQRGRRGPGFRHHLRRQRQRFARSDAGQGRCLRRHDAKARSCVDHTTASAEIARELHAEAKQRGFDFIDAPVSGGQAGAENGVLTVMCGGDAGPFAKPKTSSPLMRAPASCWAPGAGQLDQDGQSDLHRRRGAGSRRRPALRA